MAVTTGIVVACVAGLGVGLHLSKSAYNASVRKLIVEVQEGTFQIGLLSSRRRYVKYLPVAPPHSITTSRHWSIVRGTAFGVWTVDPASRQRLRLIAVFYVSAGAEGDVTLKLSELENPLKNSGQPAGPKVGQRATMLNGLHHAIQGRLPPSDMPELEFVRAQMKDFFPKMDLGGDKYWLCKGDWKAAQRAQRAERKAARRAAPGNPTDVSDSFSNADSVSGSEDESGDKLKGE